MTNPKILIVEDEGMTAMELQNQLKREGYDVPSIASSREEAIKKAIKIKPDLIIVVDGQELIKTQEFDFAIVDFAQYIESLTRDILRQYDVDSNRIALNLNIDHLMLDLNTSLLCGLIVNELITNYFKNALLKRKIHKINVDFRINDKNFVLTVTDNCNAYFENINFLYLNLKLKMLVKQLGGIIRLDEDSSEIKIIF